MSPAFIKGIRKSLPKAEITFDWFHLTKIVNDAVDKVRREETATKSELKKTRYIWLTNPKNLTRTQLRRLTSLSRQNLQTVRAYNIRLAFQDFFHSTRSSAWESWLKSLVFLGNALSPSADHRSCKNREISLNGVLSLVSKSHPPRASWRLQQSPPSGQGQSTGISI
jgi:transposase